jgi:two-component system NarL family response regulator
MPDIKVIMLTTSDDHEDIFEAIKLGASGYLVKNTDGKELINKIKQVEDGEIPLSPVLAAKILSEFNKKQDNTEKGTIRDDANTENEKLNSRQLELLALIASGKTYKKVGEILGLSERTVKYHMGRIVDILHLDNKAQVIAYAVESGMVSTNISNKNT